MNLQRVTTQFVEAEDRIRLSGEAQGGEVVVWWLTQRLMERLLPLLFQWLQGRDSGAAWAEVAQAFALQAAQAALAPQQPVNPMPQHNGLLVEAVDLSHNESAMTLTFRCADGRSTLHLEAQPMRQWLSIVYQQWQVAGWRTDVWPKWMQESVAPGDAQPAMLH